MMEDVNCPLFILHGKKDNLIPFQHSEELYDACKAPVYLHMPSNMDHNEFLVDEDLIQPMKAFISKIEEREEQKNKIRKQLETTRNVDLLLGFGGYKGDSKKDEDIVNPFLDKKEKQMVKYSFKIKNFDVSKADIEKLQNEPIPQIDEDAQTFASIDKEQLENIGKGVRHPKTLHYDVKTSTYNMQTNISKVDESFVDYLSETKIEDKYV